MKLPNLQFRTENLKLKITFFSFFVLCVLGFALTQHVFAQQAPQTYTISPPTVNQKLNPGQNAEGVLKVFNNTDQDLTFTANVRDFIVEDTIGTPQFLPTNTLSDKYSAAAWIGVTPSTFTVKPHQKQDLNYYIQVPITARPGGHYAAVTYSPSTNTGIKGTGASVNTQAGSLFYITINGPINEQASITKFFANPFQEYGPVNILTQLKNLGDLHIAPQGSITVTGLLFNKTQNLDGHNIFPEAARDYTNAFGQTWMIGRYKAVFLASYGVNNNLPLTATVYFWVFPWRLTIIIVLVAVALILGALYLRKRKKDGSKEATQAQEVAVVTPTEALEVK